MSSRSILLFAYLSAIFCGMLSLSHNCYGQQPSGASGANAAVSKNSALSVQYDIFRQQSSLQHASWAVYVHDISKQSVLLSHDPSRSLSPASVLKLLTTASALLILGPDYQYHTLLEHDGHIDEQGVLHGNLYIRGSGDPSLGSDQLHDSLSVSKVLAWFVDVVQKSGIKKINGQVVGDDSVFDTHLIPDKWLWEDIGNYFGASPGGLSVHENQFSVLFDAGNTLGAPAKVAGFRNAPAGLHYINEVTTGPQGSGDQVYIYGGPFENSRQLTGTVPLGAKSFEVRASLPNPALHMAWLLSEALKNKAVEVGGGATTLRVTGNIPGRTDKPLTELGRWTSPRLTDLIYRTNMASVNLFAENLLKTIGLHGQGQGSTKAGIEVITKFWEQRGMNTTGMKLHDGSGLSPANRITVAQIGFLLNSMAGEAVFDDFLRSLPVAATSGSLAGLLRGTSSAGVLQAKSGSLSNVRAYAGYTTMKNGNLASFVVIVNDFTGPTVRIRNEIMLLIDAITNHR